MATKKQVRKWKLVVIAQFWVIIACLIVIGFMYSDWIASGNRDNEAVTTDEIDSVDADERSLGTTTNEDSTPTSTSDTNVSEATTTEATDTGMNGGMEYPGPL